MNAKNAQTNKPSRLQPSAAALGNWLRSWVQPNGAIHGFNNHSVWGGNPYRWTDYFSGHSTWSSPFLSGLAAMLSKQYHAEAADLLKRMIDFQISAKRENGHYQHIGFETGRMGTVALIHNAAPNIFLTMTAHYGKSFLDEDTLDKIKKCVFDNLEACRDFSGGRPAAGGTCNQEYARVWAKLLFMRTFGERHWMDELQEDLDFLIQHYHVAGLPDEDCEGTLRVIHEPDWVEPAEYYGLMISPLVLAYETFGEPRYLKRALSVARHVVRSAWRDAHGQTRFHRFWFRRGGQWEMQAEPMLIAGMGHSLYGILQCLSYEHDPELSAFLNACEQTYAYYQHPRGFFVSATGWGNEIDIIPSTAWHSHDFQYLCERTIPDESFWPRFFEKQNKLSVLLGEDAIWFEDGEHWMVGEYFWTDLYSLCGRKDEEEFYRNIPDWLSKERGIPASFQWQVPAFMKTDTGIYRMPGTDTPVEIMSISKKPFLGDY